MLGAIIGVITNLRSCGPPSRHIDIYEHLSWANIAFNTPEDMLIDDSRVIKLLLSATKNGEELKQLFQGEGSIETSEVEIFDQMEAVLVAPEFQITKITPERQQITIDEETIWKWEIKPLKLGKQRLHLAINMIVSVGGKEQLRSVHTYEKEIEVNVSMYTRISTFIGNNWQWLWTTILIPIVPWVWSRRRKKNEERPWERV